jgi:translation initiation factor 2 beta subunit (eIF-2beta)/eIF-5
MDLKGYVASQHDKKSLVNQCEMIERNDTPIKHDQDDDNDNNKNRKKTRFAKSETKNKKSGSKSTTGDGQYYCKECGKNPTHDTDRCYILKRLAREKEAKANGRDKAYAKPYSKCTFCKEVNSIACRAGKHDRLKIVESALCRILP